MFGFAEMARVQNANAAQRLWPNCWPSYIVIKSEIKDKKLWFQSTTPFRLLQLIAQSILKNYVSKFKLRSCLTNDTKFSDLSVLRTKIYDFKLVYFFGTSSILLR